MFFVLKKIHKYNLKRNARFLLNSFDCENVIENAIHISTSFRKILLTKKEKNIENLFGENWYEYLNKDGYFKLSDREKELFINAPYIDKNSDKYSEENINNLYKSANEWVSKL